MIKRKYTICDKNTKAWVSMVMIIENQLKSKLELIVIYMQAHVLSYS